MRLGTGVCSKVQVYKINAFFNSINRRHTVAIWRARYLFDGTTSCHIFIYTVIYYISMVYWLQAFDIGGGKLDWCTLVRTTRRESWYTWPRRRTRKKPAISGFILFFFIFPIRLIDNRKPRPLLPLVENITTIYYVYRYYNNTAIDVLLHYIATFEGTVDVLFFIFDF